MYVSAEYSSVGSTIALYTLHFVETEIPCCDHTCFHSPPKAPELPRYVKFLTDFVACHRFQHVDRLKFDRMVVFFVLTVSQNRVAA